LSRPLEGFIVVEGRGLVPAFLGRMLADLGADVHKLEVDCGSDAIQADGDTAYDHAFGLGKHRLGWSKLADILRKADAVVTYGVGGLGPGPDVLHWRREYPRLIAVVLTPFGVDGPFATHPSSDLVNLAMGGYLHLTGTPREQPLKPTVAFMSVRHACNHALPAFLIALRRRRLTGRGSLVDVAIRDTVLWMLVNSYQKWDLQRVNPGRRGSTYTIGDMTRAMPLLFQCADGLVAWLPLAGRRATGMIRLVAWMATRNAAPDWLVRTDWHRFELESQEEIDRFIQPFADFFLTKTKAELFEAALERDVMLAPVNSIQDLFNDPQLDARGAWTHMALRGRQVRLPRSPVRLTGVGWGPKT
jgi:benzylsuccinate CoA-transferase BbsE subunit